MDTDGRICDADEAGEIVVRGYNVMTGILITPRPRLTRSIRMAGCTRVTSEHSMSMAISASPIV